MSWINKNGQKFTLLRDKYPARPRQIWLLPAKLKTTQRKTLL
ncbi:hypothetical protein UYSO10_5245 [Kosakonia radicincitans]|nr:hypothetical protein UYSO10_5245 [Kosakonia radicincitans]